MLFNLLILSALLLSACSGGVSPTTRLVGDPLTSQTSLYDGQGNQTTILQFIDHASNRIIKADVKDMEILGAVSQQLAGDEIYIANGYESKFSIVFSKNDLQIVRSEGDRTENPFDFQGEPVSADFGIESGYFVMQDDLRSIGVMKLSQSGKLEKSWLGGSLLDEEKNISAGDIDSRGNLLLALSDGSFAAADLADVLKKKKWTYTDIDSDLRDPLWVAPGSDRYSLVVGESSAQVIDTESMSVVDAQDFPSPSSDIVGMSKAKTPHFIVTDPTNDRLELWYLNAEGTIDTLELLDVEYDTYESSVFDVESQELLVMFSNGIDGVRTVTKLRLSDNLVVIKRELSPEGDAILSDPYVFIDRKASLGYLESYDLDTKESKVAQGFNFDYFRKK
jgi:hypothetical protein